VRSIIQFFLSLLPFPIRVHEYSTKLAECEINVATLEGPAKHNEQRGSETVGLDWFRCLRLGCCLSACKQARSTARLD